MNITFIAPPIVRRTETPVELDTYTSERRGGGLRAYLERPWFSSGDGELLDAVLWSGAWPPPEGAKQHITDWGLDPLYKSAAIAAQPSLSAARAVCAFALASFSISSSRSSTVVLPGRSWSLCTIPDISERERMASRNSAWLKSDAVSGGRQRLGASSDIESYDAPAPKMTSSMEARC